MLDRLGNLRQIKRNYLIFMPKKNAIGSKERSNFGFEKVNKTPGISTQARTRRRINHIHKLKDTEGDWVEWGAGLDSVVVNYFIDLFSSAPIDWQEIIDCIPMKITVGQNFYLLKSVEEIEVKTALFQMYLEIN